MSRWMKGKPKAPLQDEPIGLPDAGHIARIARGQGHGYIRDGHGRAVFFDRRDLIGVAFNDLAVGDTVAFALIDDRLSGPRGLQIRKTAGTS